MRKTAIQILSEQGDWKDNINGESEIIDAMELYAKQESLDFARWLSHQVINGRTIIKLWEDYKSTFSDAVS